MEKGYHHLRLHPSIRDWFLFRVSGNNFRCIALPFGWKLSPYYFVKLMGTMVRYVRSHIRDRIHPYMDDFLVDSRTHGKLLKVRSRIYALLKGCRLKMKEENGCWDGSRRIEHLGFIVDKEKMVFGITAKSIDKLAGIASKILSQVRRNRLLVTESLLRNFTGVEISCPLAMPLARFYTRSLYDSLKNKRGN